MNTRSLWEAITPKSSNYPELSKDIEVDVVVIGGGITGISAAQRLVEAGKQVAIVEASDIGGVTTGYTSGNLYVAVQPYYQKLISKFGLEISKKVANSRQYAIDYIENNVKEKKIDCHFSRRPWFLYTEDETKISFLEKEFESFQKMDIPIKTTDSMPLPFSFKKAVVMENQARFNALKYVRSLAENLAQQGCHIFENSRVQTIQEKNEKCFVETEKAKITAKHVIIATHTPIGVNMTQMFTAPYRSYVVAATLKDNVYPEGHFWDLNHPHHAVCTHSISSEHPEILLVAGNHHKVGQDRNAIAHYQELEKFLRKNLSISEISYRWSAQHYHSADGIPYIGLASRFAKNVYMATGFFADGLIYGTLSAIILSDLILKKENHLSEVYESNRCDYLKSSAFLFKEGGNVFWQYLTDFPFSKIKNYKDIKPGEGEVVVIDGRKCGVARDEDGKWLVVSAVCTHMKCIVNFNNAEKTWDCPCHGSRFTLQGKVIEGPATRDLPKITIKEF